MRLVASKNMYLCACRFALQTRFSHLVAYFVAEPDEDEGRGSDMWMVFPWYEMSFEDLWRSRTGVFWRAEVVSMAEQLFHGITCLHRVHIFHGNLAFSNLLLLAAPPNESGSQPVSMRLWIADFVSASKVPASRRPECQLQVQAPELALGVPVGQLTEAIDVWAAGIFVASACKGKLFPKCPECRCVLGPLAEAEWPECEVTPEFEAMRLACGSQPGSQMVSLRIWFGSDVPEDPVVDVVASMLTWMPSRRRNIFDLLEHSFFEENDSEMELRTVVHKLPRAVLEEAVIRISRRGGLTLRDCLHMHRGDPISQLGNASAPSQPAQQTIQDAGGQPEMPVEQSVEKKLALCSGNCGRLSCKHNQFAKQTICQFCVDEGRRCVWCRCETYACKGGLGECHGSRYRIYDSRWCRSCGQKVANMGSNKYANAYGQFTYGRGWGKELRLTARLGFAFVRILPMDVEAGMKFAELELQWPWKGFDTALSIAANAMKWPAAIEAFELALRAFAQKCGSQPAEVALASCIMTAAEACDGMVLKEMHDELSKTGRAGCKTGLIWLLRRLGFVTGEEDEDDEVTEPISGSQPGKRVLRKRKSAASPKTTRKLERKASVKPANEVKPEAGVQGSQCVGVQRELKLGKLQGVFTVNCGDAALAGCRPVVVRFPASSEARQGRGQVKAG